jgi:hypothetical protein
MSEPSPSRPVPGPPRPGPRPGESTALPGSPARPTAQGTPQEDPFADLAERPIAEHLAVFETEHARLERELGTIDRL